MNHEPRERMEHAELMALVGTLRRRLRAAEHEVARQRITIARLRMLLERAELDRPG